MSMSTFIPQGDAEFLSPFGPCMGYMRMGEDFANELNETMNKTLKDFSGSLVGKVNSELEFNKEIINKCLNKFSAFVLKYHEMFELKSSFNQKTLDNTTYDYGLQIISGWFVRQFENEYNPLHVHTGAKLSCVGYLQLPDGIEEEWENEKKKHMISNGHIQFASGTHSGYNLTTFLVRPKVGDFYLFPSELFHTVYPFYTKGERRSFSMNMNCIKIKKSVDK